MVVVSHIELIRFYKETSLNYTNPMIYHLGRVSVTGFFVLSGFLITRKILEQRDAGTWSFSRFYQQRALRILPAYYAIIILSIFVLPNIPVFQIKLPAFLINAHTDPANYWYYFLLIPQWASAQSIVLPYAEQSWSIGVEELFYLFAPLLIWVFRKRILLVLLALFGTFVLIKFAMVARGVNQNSFLYKLFLFHSFESIALGGILGVLVHQKSKLLNKINGRVFYLALLLMGFFFYTQKLTDNNYLHFVICFAVILAYLNKSPLAILKQRWLVYLGKISYSIYLFHEIAIGLAVKVDLKGQNSWLTYVLSLLLTVLIGSIFYYAVERPFLLFKDRLSRQEARN